MASIFIKLPRAIGVMELDLDLLSLEEDGGASEKVSVDSVKA